MKIIHICDVHFSRRHKEPALASLDRVAEVAQDENVDAFVLAGDLFDAGIQNSEKDGLPDLLDAIERLLQIAPVFAVSGTVTHDIPGCYEPLTRLNAPYSFTLVTPNEYWLKTQTGWQRNSIDNPIPDPDAELLIMGVPEPSKNWFLAGKEGIGKDEAREAIENGMRSILLGCGAVRKEHPDIPCVFLYHGSVRGASMCNGQTVPQGEIAIGRDDLAMVGAAYYALGHIHLGQQIDGLLGAHYGGSAFPVNWGETDQKTFNIVEFDSNATFADDGAGAVYVTPHNYPHPPRKKITIDFDDIEDNLDYHDYAGYQVWLNVLMKKDEASSGYNPDIQLQWLLNDGALEGSRVTIEIKSTETIRASEIRDVQHLRDKMRVYEEASDESFAASMYEKADELEAAAVASGIAPVGHRWRIDRLALRGAIGLWKNSGLEEVDIDLSTHDPGLIALVGENGSGKSTLIENMHPYTQMLTRGGKLQDHFMLRDSYRDLWVTDEATGDQWRFKMLIDGQNKSGSVEYFADRNGEPQTSGRKAEYEKVVEEQFGSLALYLRSAFITQKSTKANPDIAEATQGEKKMLFTELSGIDYLQNYSLDARDRAKTAEDSAALLEAKTSDIPNIEASIVSQRQRVIDLEVAIDQKNNAAQGEHGKAQSLKAEIVVLEPKVESLKRDRSKLWDYSTAVEEAEKEIKTEQANRVRFERALQGKGNAEHDAQAYEVLRSKLERLQKERAQALEARNTALADHNDKVKAHNATRRAFDERIAKIERWIAAKESDKKAAVDRVDDITDRLSKKVTCPNCSHEFAHGESELNVKLAELQQLVIDIDTELEEARQELKEARATDPGNPPEPPELPEYENAEINTVEAQLRAIQIDDVRATIARANEAEREIAGIDARIAAAKKTASDARVNIAEIEARIKSAGDVEAQHKTKTSELETARTRYEELMRESASLDAQRREVENQITETEKRIEALKADREEMERHANEAREWRVLERVCGPNGIQALELDALAPSITDIANRLLGSSYGTRFRIEIETQREGGAGSKRKMIEDFVIKVHDAERETEQTLDTLSGGESVWVRKALYDAFGIIRAQNTGVQFQTAFLDEADGALDPEARSHYFAMIEAAHIEAGRSHTIVITHSPEAQDMISQKIDMAELSEPVREAIPA